MPCHLLIYITVPSNITTLFKALPAIRNRGVGYEILVILAVIFFFLRKVDHASYIMLPKSRIHPHQKTAVVMLLTWRDPGGQTFLLPATLPFAFKMDWNVTKPSQTSWCLLAQEKLRHQNIALCTIKCFLLCRDLAGLILQVNSPRLPKARDFPVWCQFIFAHKSIAGYGYSFFFPLSLQSIPLGWEKISSSSEA